MQIRILTSDDVKTALPMPKAIEIMKRAFGQLSAGKATVPLRSKISSDKGDTLLMPAYLHGSQGLGIKIVSIYKDNPSKDIPTVTAIVIVLDPQTGQPRALIEGDSLTAIRTGATGGLASDLLARRDAKTVALFGAGVQARAQLQGVIAVRSITRINLLDLSLSTSQKLADEIATWEEAPAVNLVSNSKEAIQDADIIITATTSSKPVFDGHGLKAGTHITGVGSYTPQMREVDETTVQRARIVVDSREACLAEAGDLIISKATVDAELGEIINGIKPGRHSDEEITFFKTVGVAVEDAAAAAAILSEAETNGLGKVIEVS
jgi:ornithine cyclodeaminase/alanine dehydrogenase-like protein (mu-crystallin family)